MNVETRERRTLPHPVYNVSPDGKSGVAPSFSRLNDRRPGYGYAGVPDDQKTVPAPDEMGMWRVDLESGKQELLFSLADAVKIPYTGNKDRAWVDKSIHWFNHLLFNTDGSRCYFLHRWQVPGGGWATRAFTINPDGSNPFVLDPYGYTSHFIWRDPKHVMAWAYHPSHGRKFYLYEDKTENVEVMAPDVMVVNGHNTYLPGNRWILNDTYPDKERLQHPYLFDTRTGRRRALGHFLSPREYSGEWRCDTHPRFSPNGRMVTIDSPHSGGRQIYLIDISAIVS